MSYISLDKKLTTEEYDVLNAFYENNWNATERTFSRLSKKAHLKFLEMISEMEIFDSKYSTHAGGTLYSISRDKRKNVLKWLINYEDATIHKRKGLFVI